MPARALTKTSTVKPTPRPGWTFLTNHSHVLLSLAAEPELRIRDLAVSVGITERAVQRILAELQEEGVLKVEKSGRRNRYAVDRRAAFKHPVEAHCRVGQLIDLVLDTPRGA